MWWHLKHYKAQWTSLSHKLALGVSTTNIHISRRPTPRQKCTLSEVKKVCSTLMDSALPLPTTTSEQPGPHTWVICTSKRECTLGPIPKMLFSASSEHCNTGPLNCSKVSSHTHPTLLSHWVQTAFVTSTQQGFPLALVSTQHSVVGCQHY